MDNVISELKNIVVIKTNSESLYGINYSEQPYKMCILSAGIHEDDIYKLNKLFPIKVINNKLNSDHKNTFKIKLEDYNKRCSNLYYHRYNFFNIHQMYFENDEWYLIVSDCFDVNDMRYIINLPHNTKNYFFNRKTFRCTCNTYRKNKNCEHKTIFISNVNDIKYYFVLCLLNNLDISVSQCLDILYSSNRIVSLLL